MGHVFERLQAILFEKTLSRYAKLLSKDFFTATTAKKFELYKNLLCAEVETIKELQNEEFEFVKKIQLLRLKKVLILAAQTKWWNDHFLQNKVAWKNIATFDELHTIPPITRHNIVDVEKKDLLLVDTEDPSLLWRSSSGSTTGTPVVWGLNKTILILNVLASLLIQLEKRGFSLSTNLNHKFCLHYNMFMTADKHAFKWFAQPDFHIPNHSSDRRKKTIELSLVIAQTQNLVLFTSPNELISLVDSFRDVGDRPHIPFIITVGSPLPPHVRDTTTQYFHSQIFSFYGAQETGPCAIECVNVKDAYHALSDRIILELLDEHNRPVKEGKAGLITVTCLDNTVMPLIRYQPGDWGVFISNSLCTCGNHFPLFKVLERTTDVVTFSNGERLSIVPILRFFNRPPYISFVRRFQIEQDRHDHIIVRLEVKKLLPETAIIRLHERIERVFKGKLQADVVQITNIAQENSKFRVFIPLKTPRP